MDVRELAARVFMLGFEGEEPDAPIRDFLARGVRAVILFGRNAADGEAVVRLTRQLGDAAGRPLVIAADQEGGSVLRFRHGATLWPSAMGLGRLPVDEVQRLGRACGDELRAMGVNMNLAPVADLNTPDNPGIGTRSFGADAASASAAVAAWTVGLQQAGVAATVKHFPGLGGARADTHLETTVIASPRAELARDLAPFHAAFAAGARAAMTSHAHYAALDPDRPATVSRAVLTDLLRGELGFGGVMVTDDLRMGAITAHGDPPEACVQALEAGADLLLICRDASVQAASLAAVVRAVEQRRLPRARLEEAAARVEALVEWTAAQPPPARALGRLVARHAPLVDGACDRIVHVLRDRDRLLPLTWHGSDVLLLFPRLEQHTPVEERVSGEDALLDSWCARLGGATLVRYDPDTVDPERGELHEQLWRSPRRVLFTAEGHLRPAQRKLIEAAAQSPRTVLAALRTPHDADVAPAIGTAVCAYGYLPNALAALGRTLFGVVNS